MDPASPPVVRLRPEKVIKKIPGHLPPLSSRDKEACIDSLSSKSTADLKELLERQEKILSNKFLLQKLKDNGAKAADLKSRIETELKSRCDVDRAASLLADMSLSQLSALEWTGHNHPGYDIPSSNHNDDDIEHEESNPLKIIASHSGITYHQKQLRLITSEEKLITPDDMREVAGFNKIKPIDSLANELISQGNEAKPSTSCLLDEPEPFAHLVCKRFGHVESKDRFKPNKPLKPFIGVFPIQPPGRISSKINRSEETNVTPPLPLFGDAKLLTLEESMQLQRQQAQKLKDVQMKHAAERLLSLRAEGLVGSIPSTVSSSMAYRRVVESSSDSDDDNGADQEEQELHDDDQHDHDTAVVYNVEA